VSTWLAAHDKHHSPRRHGWRVRDEIVRGVHDDMVAEERREGSRVHDGSRVYDGIVREVHDDMIRRAPDDIVHGVHEDIVRGIHGQIARGGACRHGSPGTTTSFATTTWLAGAR
jgi:hypothetical protein